MPWRRRSIESSRERLIHERVCAAGGTPATRTLARDTIDVDTVDTSINVALEGNAKNRLNIVAGAAVQGRPLDPADKSGRYTDSVWFVESGGGPFKLYEPIRIQAGSRAQLSFWMKSKLHIEGDSDSPASVTSTGRSPRRSTAAT